MKIVRFCFVLFVHATLFVFHSHQIIREVHTPHSFKTFNKTRDSSYNFFVLLFEKLITY